MAMGLQIPKKKKKKKRYTSIKKKEEFIRVALTVSNKPGKLQ